MKVEALMTRDVKSCRPDQSLAEAAHLMWSHDCGCVPVTGSSDRVLGIITDRDICMAAYFTGRPLAQISVDESMSRDVMAVRPEDSIEVAEAIMKRVQVRRLPVTDPSGRIVGMLSLNDIAREATKQPASKTSELALSEVAMTLGAVCEQHRRSMPTPARVV
jgi:CBS domain-containing protein